MAAEEHSRSSTFCGGRSATAILLALSVLLTVSGPAIQSALASFSAGPIVNISNSPGHSSYQKTAVSGSNVYVVWMDSTGIMFSVSNDNGATFSTPVSLSNGAAGSIPQIVATGNNVYVIWLGPEGPSGASLEFIASHDNGATFGPILNLGTSELSYSPIDIAAAGDNVYVVFQHGTPDGTEMLFRASHDSGNSFERPYIFRKGLCIASEPHVAASGKYVYVTTQDPCNKSSNLMFKMSRNEGRGFGGPFYFGSGQLTQISAVDQYVYLAWQAQNSDVNFRVSSNNGRSFAPAITLNEGVQVSNATPRMYAAGESVYLVWDSNVEANDFTSVLFSHSSDNGASFGPLLQLTPSSEYAINPAVTSIGSNVVVVWENITGFGTTPAQILMKTSSDDGNSFDESATVLDSDTSDALGFVRPAVSASPTGNYVYASWWRSATFDESADIVLTRLELSST